MDKLVNKSTRTLVCESCGAEFSCGANTGACWCFEIDLTGEKLNALRENYTNCLCKDCLVREDEPPANAN